MSLLDDDDEELQEGKKERGRKSDEPNDFDEDEFNDLDEEE